MTAKHLLAMFLAFGWTAAHAAEPRVNLLLVTADDMNADSSGWMGNKLGATPNLDAFAKTAHKLINNHNTCPICQPGREALLTGRVPHRSGALGFQPIRKDVPTLVEVLRAAGYHAAAIEKIVHMAPPEKFPWDDKRAGGVGKDPAKFRAAFREVLATAAASKKPFFINANITDPHRPFVGSGKAAAKGQAAGGVKPYRPADVTVPSFLEDIPRVREEVAQYYTSVRRFDVTFGHVMDELKAAGRLEDTVVVFWSDHGMSFPFSKATVYRNGTWSPLLVRLPKMAAPGEWKEFVSSVDFMPSVLDILGVKAPSGMDGRSWRPLLLGEKQADRDFVITHVNTVSSGRAFPQRCVRTATRSLMFHGWPDGTAKFRVEAMSGLSFQAMRAEPKAKGRVEQLTIGEPLMLFDLTADPDERRNLIGDTKYQDEAAALAKRLGDHMERTGDPQAEAFRAAWAKHTGKR